MFLRDILIFLEYILNSAKFQHLFWNKTFQTYFAKWDRSCPVGTWRLPSGLIKHFWVFLTKLIVKTRVESTFSNFKTFLRCLSTILWYKIGGQEKCIFNETDSKTHNSRPP